MFTFVGITVLILFDTLVLRVSSDVLEPNFKAYANSLDPDETLQNMASHQDPNYCCSGIPDEASSCRGICIKMGQTRDSIEQISLLLTAPRMCPDHLGELWKCLEHMAPVLSDLRMFSGRPCCNLTKTKTCREACVKAQSAQDVLSHCSQSTEDHILFQCIERQKDAEPCCGHVSGEDSFACQATCWSMYFTNTVISPDSKRQLRHYCKDGHRDVVNCVNKQTRTTRQSSSLETLHCCDSASNQLCMQMCKETLQSDLDPDQKMNQVIEACGTVDLKDPLYMCFLKNPQYPLTPKEEDLVGIDTAKLHCCEKAESERCGSLCVKTHGHKWATFRKFEQSCGVMSSPISTMETSMHSCLKDVEEPCQLGCSGLHYCTNLNHRPTEHFRSCNLDADNAARRDILLWQNGTIDLPNLSVPVKDIRTCEPEMFKAIACAYQIKPCLRKAAPLQICQEDCVYMNKCVDKTRVDGKMVLDRCKRLPKASSGECISVGQYKVESPHKHPVMDVTNPCKPSPCAEDEVCVIYRRKCRHSSSCPHYMCKKGCKLGQVSKVLVPVRSVVLIPEYKNNEMSTDSCVHYRLCHCSSEGHIGACKDVSCVPNNHCRTENSLRIFQHGQYFTQGCNDCVCFGGRSVCSRRHCVSGTHNTYTGMLNCECPAVYKPVCGVNGRTYPSACMAQCAGQVRFMDGDCSQHSSCTPNPCETGYRCVVHRQVCFGASDEACLQYRCVPEVVNQCNIHDRDPVCDSHGVEFTNECIMLAKGHKQGYRGHCVIGKCSALGPVCGQDGETYNSECAALAARSTVDYQGLCKTYPTRILRPGEVMHSSLCDGVVCAAVVPPGCQGIIPPGACCPVCASSLLVLSLEALGSISIEARRGPLTVQQMLGAVSDMLEISECDVFGYLSITGDIVLIVKTVVDNPTFVQVQACIKEAERLEYLIQSRNPAITSNLVLTPMLYATLHAPNLTLASVGAMFNTQPLHVIVTLILLHFTHQTFGVL